MGALRCGGEGVHGPARRCGAVAGRYRRRRPRLAVLRRGSALLGLAAALLAALQGERGVQAQCSGRGLSDEVLCQALGKECGEVPGASLRVHCVVAVRRRC